MLRAVCTRYKHKPSISIPLTNKRLRTTKSFKPPFNKFRRAPTGSSSSSTHHGFKSSPRSSFSAPFQFQFTPAPPLSDSQCADYFNDRIKKWTNTSRILFRFVRFGYDIADIQPFLAAYASTAKTGFFTSSEEMFQRYQISRFSICSGNDPAKFHFHLAEADATFSNIFFSWISKHRDSSVLDDLVEQGKAKAEVLGSLRHLAKVSIRRPAEEYPWARKMRRKIIMHVGPTNSGKTHHALRALAAAESGVYAGPLRLLAHEIWERLNLGQIVPLGVEVEQPIPVSSSSSSSSSNATTNTTTISTPNPSIAPRAAKIHSNPAYARQTNMITGEEKKIVADDATLYSCTVEMISTRQQFDVAVVDEIQMIGDPQRGYAWTQAVLGLCARELHLCGEESAIPVVQELLKETGDELTVRRYERLTPLLPEEKSLGGDFSNVQKGDCVVAFSRTRIFEIKKEIEKKSGLRCAVVYGKLPPEIRSEQAALFNDPDSAFDVIIGSDAIGMGLNLKIRRIIFDRVVKIDGSYRLIPLTISQIKQIAGRAGRYGHSLSGEKPGGFVTTLHEKDLPILKRALEHPSTPTLTHAYIAPTGDSFITIASALPCTKTPSPQSSGITLETALMAHSYTSLPPLPVYKYFQNSKTAEVCAWIEPRDKGVLTWGDKLTLLNSPIAWRDPNVVDALEKMMKLQRDYMFVPLENVVGRSGMMSALEVIERRMASVKARKTMTDTKVVEESSSSEKSKGTVMKATEKRQKLTEGGITEDVKPEQLESLESLHKILVLYMSLHFKNTVVYADRVAAETLKHRVEVALDWGLQQVGKGKMEEESVGKRVGERPTRRHTETRKVSEFGEKGRVMNAIKELQLHHARDGSTSTPRSKQKPSSPRATWLFPSKKEMVTRPRPLPRPGPLPLPLPPIQSDLSHPSSPSTSSTGGVSRFENNKYQSSSGVGYTSGGIKSAKTWDRAPDMTEVLKMYAAHPSLKVNGRK